MIERSKRHLAEAGETYWQHMHFAAAVGLMTIGAGLACLIHALIPALCQGTCSRTVNLLQDLFRDHGSLHAIEAQASGVVTFVSLIGLSLLSGNMPTVAGGPFALGISIALLSLTVPLTFLLSNSELAPVTD